MPQDVLALGRHLVEELGEERGDTLSIWMAHHVADLISQARSLPSGPRRAKSQKLATDTILKIWEHREALPHYAYPLAPYAELLKVLDVLQPNENPYRFSRLSRIDQSAAVLFDRLSRLVILVLLLHVDNAKQANVTSREAVKALDSEEKQVHERLNEWLALLPGKAKAPRKRKRTSQAKTSNLKLDVEGIRKSIVQFIDDCSKALVDLRAEVVNGPTKQED